MKITKEQVLDLVNRLNERFTGKYLMLISEGFYEIAVDGELIVTIYDTGTIGFDGSYHDLSVKGFIMNWLGYIKNELKGNLDHEHGLAATPHFGCECIPKEWLSSNDDNSSELDQILIDTAKNLKNQIEDCENSMGIHPEVSEMSNSLLDIVKYLDSKGFNNSTSKSIKEAIDESLEEFNKRLF